MNAQNESQAQEELRNDLPSPEESARLLDKATKVTSWLSALKQQTRQRLFVGKSEDGLVVVALRNYRIELLDIDESLKNASTHEIVSRLCEGHNAALGKMDEWSANQCAALAKAAGITGDFELPF